MNRTELHSQIDLLIEKMAANNRLLKQHEGKFSQLETDLLRKQCIELYDTINQLHIANMMEKGVKPVIQTKVSETEKTENAIHKKESLTEPEIPQTELKRQPELLKEETKKEIEIIPEKKDELKPEKAEHIRHAVSDAPKFIPIVERPAPESVSPPKKEPNTEKSVLDKINETKANVTLHESISSKSEEKELSHLFANSKIAKIKDAIDISKRFEIQSNLFRADSNAFNISIGELENAGNKNRAIEIFNEFANRYHWNVEDELVKELKSFIYRKY